MSVDGRVDAADEGAGHGGDVVHRLARGGTVFEGAQVSVDDAAIDGLGKDEGDIDVDAFGNQGFHRGQAGRRGGDLDHEVWAVHRGDQAAGFFDRALGVVGQARGNLQADEAVGHAGLVEDRAQHVAGGGDVVNGDGLEHLLGREALGAETADVLVVGVAALDGLLEDRGVGGHAADALFGDQAGEFSRVDKVPAEEVQPDALTVRMQFVQRGLRHRNLRGRSSVGRPRSSVQAGGLHGYVCYSNRTNGAASGLC